MFFKEVVMSFSASLIKCPFDGPCFGRVMKNRCRVLTDTDPRWEDCPFRKAHRTEERESNEDK